MALSNRRLLAAALAASVAFGLYGWTAAPGLTWAHYGADGGELLAAAVTNGVPHPPGYPLYILLLQLWLAAGRALAPAVELARLGNLLSAFLGALAVGVTVLVIARLLDGSRHGVLWALLAGLSWAISPLLWGQALITEVYTLHCLLIALLGWAALARPCRWWLQAILVGLGLANHATYALLLPAVLYQAWATCPAPRRLLRLCLTPSIGIGIAALLHLRTPWAAAGSGLPPPVNWGYADSWPGVWWLVSGAAYRHYMFGVGLSDLFGRVAALAYSVASQFTVLGLAIAVVGLAYVDQHRPVLRNFALIWIVPVAIYAISYNTVDSEIYLLPITWMGALCLGYGFVAVEQWLMARSIGTPAASPWLLVSAVVGIGLLALVLWRAPALSLRNDQEAREFLAATIAVIEPDSIVVSSGDARTFALWYGAWATGELERAAPGVVLVNEALYQFSWYRRLLAGLYPDVAGVDISVAELIERHADRRPVYFTETPPDLAADRLMPSGLLWRYRK